MALNKQVVPINFAHGLDTKTDPKQVQLGKFLSLVNSVFTKAGLLAKRNGFGRLTSLPDANSTYLTTFNGNLTAISDTIHAYSQGSKTWVSKGNIKPAEMSVLPLIRTNTNQSQADSVGSANGLVCTVYTDQIPSGGSTAPSYKYVVADSTTGQNIVSPTVIAPASGTVTGSPRVFLLGAHFVIVFTNDISGTYHLQYIAISTTNPTVITANVDISAVYTPATTVNFDGYVTNNSLYLAWNGSDGAVKVSRIDSALTLYSVKSFATQVATHMSVTADTTGVSPIIYASYYDSSGSTAYTLAVDQNLNTVLAPTSVLASGTMKNITSAAKNGVCTVVFEVDNAYSYDSAIKTNYLEYKTVTQAGTVAGPTVIVRSLGLAAKAFIIDSQIYLLGVQSSTLQPTYFMVDLSGHIIAKLAYQNASGYYAVGLPSANVTSKTVQFAYFFKDLVEGVNKTQGAATSAGVYSQTGINFASITLSVSNISTVEIASTLNLTGGVLTTYDGYSPVENGFHLYPENVNLTGAGTGGLMTAQQYYYVATYEWSDNQGNVYRSAPSIPVSVTTTGTTSKVTVKVPTLRLTAKTANPAKVVIYRWSAAQQTYYQVTSIPSPVLNDTTADSISFIDTQADSAIIGNNILYTTGGVLENIGPPAASVVVLFNNRLWLIPSEAPNTLWYSKQVIENVPVEMSDLLTMYIAPTTSAQSSTGPTRCACPMDDKLILFKKGSVFYINGQGPDNTGANSQYSDAIYITSTVGCDNQQSIVLTPNGIMFESDKGIWLLGRDLSTQYIGAPVEDYTTDATVLSAINVPGTNQIRFNMSTGVTLMYDYYYGEWSTFVGIPSISSTVYQSLHTYLNSYGQVYQETPDLYLDGSLPVLMSFKTSWANLAGLQGYERAYFFYLLGTYLSPHKLAVQIAYDYNPSPTQTTVITPDNYAATWGGLANWGAPGPWGGENNLEQWRVFLQTQKCEAFQITLSEVFDASYGTVAGAGLTLSGLDLVVGTKSGYPRLKGSRSVG